MFRNVCWGPTNSPVAELDSVWLIRGKVAQPSWKCEVPCVARLADALSQSAVSSFRVFLELGGGFNLAGKSFLEELELGGGFLPAQEP